MIISFPSPSPEYKELASKFEIAVQALKEIQHMACNRSRVNMPSGQSLETFVKQAPFKMGAAS